MHHCACAGGAEIWDSAWSTQSCSHHDQNPLEEGLHAHLSNSWLTDTAGFLPTGHLPAGFLPMSKKKRREISTEMQKSVRVNVRG